MKLLIVDDNANWRKFIRNEFEDKFSEIQECDDGAMALDKYSRTKPDWVFMDIFMKTMDGIKATREIISSYPDARIIMVTDHNNDHLKAASTEAGASAYVLKENLQELIEIIKQ